MTEKQTEAKRGDKSEKREKKERAGKRAKEGKVDRREGEKGKRGNRRKRVKSRMRGQVRHRIIHLQKVPVLYVLTDALFGSWSTVRV